MYRGLEDGAFTFRFSDFKSFEEWPKALVRPYCRYEYFIDQCANDEVSEDDGMLMIDELFKQGRLSADETRHSLHLFAES